MNIDKHADKVVEAFQRSLTKAQLDALDANNFEELQILIEAALGTVIAESLNSTATEMELLAKSTRKHAASIEALER